MAYSRYIPTRDRAPSFADVKAKYPNVCWDYKDRYSKFEGDFIGEIIPVKILQASSTPFTKDGWNHHQEQMSLVVQIKDKYYTFLTLYGPEINPDTFEITGGNPSGNYCDLWGLSLRQNPRAEDHFITEGKKSKRCWYPNLAGMRFQLAIGTYGYNKSYTKNHFSFHSPEGLSMREVENGILQPAEIYQRRDKYKAEYLKLSESVNNGVYGQQQGNPYGQSQPNPYGRAEATRPEPVVNEFEKADDIPF